VPFESQKAADLNREIYEKMYYFALSESCQMAKESKPYEYFHGSPLSNGLFQFDMYNDFEYDALTIGLQEWDELRANIVSSGVRNSLLIAQMPTATTSQIMGNNESIDPLTSNIYRRVTLSGDFMVINKYMYNHLNELGLLSDEEFLNSVRMSQGSIQDRENIPLEVREIYKTCWEIPQKAVIDQSAERQRFIDQSQSLNLHVADLSFSKFSSMIHYGWSKKLKTGCYYLRSRSSAEAKKVLDRSNQPEQQAYVCTEDVCTACQ
jgi:ribonucleoside-diphosphate reductase alpha chain